MLYTCVCVYRYAILPVSDLNFGAILLSKKKSRTIEIENRGEKHDFKFTISKMVREARVNEDDVRHGGGKGAK